MDFFDKLGKKANETYKATMEKANSLSEEIKIKGKMTEAKEKIEKIYTEIGKFVYSELKEGRDASREEVTAKCEEINQLNDELSKLEADLLATRNKKKCASCGVEIDIKAEFCPKCGKEQPKQETVEVQDEPENANEVEATEENNDNNDNN